MITQISSKLVEDMYNEPSFRYNIVSHSLFKHSYKFYQFRNTRFDISNLKHHINNIVKHELDFFYINKI